MATLIPKDPSLIWMALVVLIVLVTLARGLGTKTSRKPSAKRLLTDREQAMHNRLTQSLPNMVVLAQVSFGALLKSKDQAVRNTFDRKIADFVVCDKAFRVQAIIELDDSSHRNRQRQDQARDALLTGAGYRVLRYPNVPDILEVQRAFAPASVSTTSEVSQARIEPTLHDLSPQRPVSSPTKTRPTDAFPRG